VTLGELSVAIPLAAACVVISGFCSGTEVALFSLRRVDREQLLHSDLSADRRILRLLERPRRLIATVLIGNQTFNSLLAVIALAVVLRAGWVDSLLATAGIALALALPLVVLIAEVTSKTLAAKAPLSWARACALPLALFTLLVTPVRVVVQAITNVLLKPLGDAARTRPARDLSEAEFRTLIDAGSAQGQVDARERRLIHRVFEFNDKNVGQVMTPRERIFALAYDLPVQRLFEEIASRGFSRVPIYQKSLDNVRGILNAKDLVRAAAGQPLGRPFVEILHEPLFVPRTTPVKRLFLTFKQKKVHMAIVVSEYGKVLGLVTMDDLLSQIFGVLRDERADLQASIPPGTRRAPVTGPPRSGSSPGPELDRDGVTPAAGVDTGVVTKIEGSDETGPVPRADSNTDPSGPIVQASPDTDGSGPIPVDPLPPQPPPGLRPIHRVDELTPPAIDINELRGDRGKPS
jgi:putative hemolysin